MSRSGRRKKNGRGSSSSSSSPSGFLDACCRPPRNYSEYESDDPERGGMTDDDVVEVIKLSSVGVLTIVVVQLFLKVLWELATIVPGFALFDGAPTTFSAYTHAGWWMSIDTVALFMGATSVYFGLNYNTESGVLERGVGRTVTWLSAYMIVLVFAAVGDLVHAGFSISEAVTCDSTLCTGNKWTLIVLLVVLFVRAFIFVWGIYRAYVYRENLKRALAEKRLSMSLSDSSSFMEDQQSSESYAPPLTPAPASARISTPLLATTIAARQQQKNKKLG